jgi:hypothetical protein
VAADLSELLAYGRHVASVVERTTPSLTKVVELGARHIQQGAQQRFDELTDGPFLPHYPKAITFDMLGRFAAEVGPDASKPQGGMGRGIEFGSSNTGPIPHMLPAADDEEGRFGDQVALIVERALR